MPPGLRKSGMPDSVLMPAPVKKRTRLLLLSSSRSAAISPGSGADITCRHPTIRRPLTAIGRLLQLDLAAQSRFQPIVHRDHAIAARGQARVDADDDSGTFVDDRRPRGD